ncbi:MAG: 3-demethylubiquinone-9 3-O-methyltransferase, partial [Methylobacterium sp.]
MTIDETAAGIEAGASSSAGLGFVDPGEVARFDALAATWWDPRGPMRVLHRFNPVRLAYIRDTVCRHYGRSAETPFALDGLSVVDVGCGGGVLSEPLARLGADVTGLDPAVQNIAAP